MVGDTAQTVTSRTAVGTVEERAFLGLIKVLPVAKIQAGISYWGWAKMPPTASNGVWMDWWLRDIIHRRDGDYNTLDELAGLLEEDLRRSVPRMEDDEFGLFPLGNGGVHLAGFVDVGGTRIPNFWHIHNGQSQATPGQRIDPQIVNAVQDCTPKRFIEIDQQGQSYVTRNGDIEAYVGFFGRHLDDYVQEIHRELGYVWPFPALGQRAEFWSAQIKFISAMYEAGGIARDGTVAQMIKGIGDQVTILTISNGGIRSYYTR